MMNRIESPQAPKLPHHKKSTLVGEIPITASWIDDHYRIHTPVFEADGTTVAQYTHNDSNPHNVNDPTDQLTSFRDISGSAKAAQCYPIRLGTSGVYKLTKNIVFGTSEDRVVGESTDHETFETEDTIFVNIGRNATSVAPPFHFGVFAGFVIETDDIVLDLDGYSISMSFSLLRDQRFFSLICLGSQPFPMKTAGFTSRVVPATNVTIKNGILGAVSHHSISGNRPSRLRIEHIECKDWEVAAVSINGACDVSIEHVCSKQASKEHVLNGNYSMALDLLRDMEERLNDVPSDTVAEAYVNFLTDLTNTVKAASSVEELKTAADPLFLTDEVVVNGEAMNVSDANHFGFYFNSSFNVFEVINDVSVTQPPAQRISCTDVSIDEMHSNSVEILGIRATDLAPAVSTCATGCGQSIKRQCLADANGNVIPHEWVFERVDAISYKGTDMDGTLQQNYNIQNPTGIDIEIQMDAHYKIRDFSVTNVNDAIIRETGYLNGTYDNDNSNHRNVIRFMVAKAMLYSAFIKNSSSLKAETDEFVTIARILLFNVIDPTIIINNDTPIYPFSHLVSSIGSDNRDDIVGLDTSLVALSTPIIPNYTTGFFDEERVKVLSSTLLVVPKLVVRSRTGTNDPFDEVELVSVIGVKTQSIGGIDSRGHFGKGSFGIRFDHCEDITLHRVHVTSSHNVSAPAKYADIQHYTTFPTIHASPYTQYKTTGFWGMTASRCERVKVTECDITDCHAKSGTSIGFVVANKSRDVVLDGCSVKACSAGTSTTGVGANQSPVQVGYFAANDVEGSIEVRRYTYEDNVSPTYTIPGTLPHYVTHRMDDMC